MPASTTVRRALASALLAAGLAACAPGQGAGPAPAPTTAPALPTTTPLTGAPAPTSAPALPTTTPPTSAPALPTTAPALPTTAPAAPITAARPTVQSFLEAYFAGGDAFVYLGGQVGAEVAAGSPLHQYMGERPDYRGFTVHEAEPMFDGGASVWADVTYGDTTVEQRFTLAGSLGEWVIVAIDVVGTRPAERAPGAGAPWQSALSGDLNGDGTTEQVSYKPVQIQLPPVGFSDPSIVAVLLASTLSVTMEAAPGGRELLALSPSALTAEGELLIGFDGEQLAGFLVVVYGGERHSFRVTPLRADGSALGDQAHLVIWSDPEGGYRLGQ